MIEKSKVIQAIRTLRETIPEKETHAGVYGAPDNTPDRQREAINTLIRELDLSGEVEGYTA